MNQSEYLMKRFDSLFTQIITPKLIDCGFERCFIREGWMKPCYLYYCINSELYFSCSYDWRDNYIDCSIGDAYEFKDAMPRIVVLYHYNIFYKILLKENLKYKYFWNGEKAMRKYLEKISLSLECVIENYSSTVHINKEIHSEHNRLKPHLIKKITKIEELPLIKD